MRYRACWDTWRPVANTPTVFCFQHREADSLWARSSRHCALNDGVIFVTRLCNLPLNPTSVTQGTTCTAYFREGFWASLTTVAILRALRPKFLAVNPNVVLVYFYGHPESALHVPSHHWLQPQDTIPHVRRAEAWHACRRYSYYFWSQSAVLQTCQDGSTFTTSQTTE